jgi:predicted phage tail protein
LTWSHAPGKVHAYRVYRGEERIASTQSTQHEDRGLAAGSYTYSVSVVNEFGTEGARSIVAVVQVPATAP